MRAALLPAGGDPFLIAYWLRNFRAWADYVDELRIIVCDQDNYDIRKYLISLVNPPKIQISFLPRTDHGEVIRILLEETSADIVMLCEDDAFIRKPEQIDKMFRMVESGKTDVVGCPRATGTPGILDWARARYGDWDTVTGESGPILWPCFLFAKRADLLRTDCHFGAWGRKAGERIMGQMFPEEQAMDTFGWTTIQLREMGLRVRVEPNYRAQRDLLPDWTDAPWFHVGGLSAGYGLYLLGPEQHREGFWASLRGTDLYDWEKRMSWWGRVIRRWDGRLTEHREAYKRALEEFMTATGMRVPGVNQWATGFDKLITWQE